MKKITCCLWVIVCSLYATSQSYKKLHSKLIVVDTHNDFPSAAIEKAVSFDADLKGKTHSDLKRMKQGGVDVQVFSIFCGPEQKQPYSFANREIDSVYEWVRRNPADMMLVKTPGDLKQAVKEKKLATMLGVEGGHMIEDKLENLDKLYERGVRYMTITWNNSTSWASSAADETAPSKSPPVGETLEDSVKRKGISNFGKQVIKRMNELGMIVDISHNGEQTFRDVINTSTKPIIASHSCVYNLCPHWRNLKDDQIISIGKNGGVIHLNFYAGFIDNGWWSRCASLRSIDTRPDVTELLAGKEEVIFAKLKAEAEKAMAEDGADVIVLGSTTMHQSAQYLAANLPIPVLNPGQVAWKQLELLIGLGLTHSKKAFPSPEVGKDVDIRRGWQ